jgi:hypothetical protein
MRPRAEMHEAWQAPSQTNWTSKRLADPAGTGSEEWIVVISTTTTSSPPVGVGPAAAAAAPPSARDGAEHHRGEPVAGSSAPCTT